MPCYHPKKMFDTTPVFGYTKNNKLNLKYCQYEVFRLYYNKLTKKYIYQSEQDYNLYGDLSLTDFFIINLPLHSEVPCGQCSGCRIDRSREWANRMLCELQYHTQAWFLTLTYDDDHLDSIHRFYGDPETGEALPCLSLNPNDLQAFLKKLRVYQSRRYPEYKIRFYAAGEYGEKTFRPHYHLICYDLFLDADELKIYKKSDHGFYYYICDWLTNLWSKGYVVVAPVTWATCAYVARYCTKKLTGESAEFYNTFNLEPPFSRMSLKPGIGYQYFVDHCAEIYHYDRCYVAGEDTGYNFKPPRYFDRLYAELDSESLDNLKHCRRYHAECNDEWFDVFTEYDKLERLGIQELEFNSRIASLVRVL